PWRLGTRSPYLRRAAEASVGPSRPSLDAPPVSVSDRSADDRVPRCPMRRLTLLLLLFAAGAFAPAAQAAPCFTTMSVGAVRTATAGATHFEATGKTVSNGKTIDTFPVTILGVLDDGIGVDHDMIIAQVHDYPALNNDRVKGIWAGMSGSPVYFNNKLVGAISYGLATTSPI